MDYLIFTKNHWGGSAETYICDDETLVNSANEHDLDFLQENYPEKFITIIDEDGDKHIKQIEDYDIESALSYHLHDFQQSRVFDELEIAEIATGKESAYLLHGLTKNEAQQIIKKAKEYYNKFR